MTLNSTPTSHENLPETADRHEEFMRLFTHHEPEIRGFIRSLVPTLTDADEVLQETALVIWKKFASFEKGSDFMRWACVIARFEALEYRRKMARDRLVLGEDVAMLLAEEAVEEMPKREKERQALDFCLKKLPENQQKLIVLAYTPGIKSKDIAEDFGKTSTSVYMALNRIRAALMKCVETRIKLSAVAGEESGNGKPSMVGGTPY